MSGTIRVGRAILGGACALALAGLAAPTTARAGDKHHKRQLYQAVQGYMLQAPAANTAPTSCPHSHCSCTSSTPSPQSFGGGVPDKGTPQMGTPAAPQPSLGQAPPIMTLPPPAAAPSYSLVAMPNLGQAPAAPIQTLAAPTLGTPMLGVAPVQQVQYQVVTVPIQQVAMPVLGQAPAPPAQAATATPVTVLVPYEKHCLLNWLHH